jgi:hypothetical protein
VAQWAGGYSGNTHATRFAEAEAALRQAAVTLRSESPNNQPAKAVAEQLRARVERVCIAAEIDLADRLPGAESLAEGARQRFTFDPSWFTDVAIQTRGRETIERLGWPGRVGAGMMRVLLWFDRRRAA